METQSNPRDGARGVRGIDVAGLERQLAATWRETAAGEGAAGKSGVTRVCVANLIVYSPSASGREGLGVLLEEVAAQTPSRVIMLQVERGGEPRLDAHVSTRCRPALKGRRQLCGEQITIEAGGRMTESVASAVEPLLVPDIAAFLWWQDIPNREDKLFSRLVEMVDRVVIDSAAFDRPREDLGRVAGLVAGRGEELRLSDLNWGRLTSWRSIVADFWDVPEYREHLDALDRVEIEYEPSAIAPAEVAAQALLTAGWLSSRLGWRPAGTFVEGRNESRVGFTSRGGGIDLVLRASGEAGGGRIRRVVLGGAGAAEFRAALGSGGATLETSARIGDALHVGRVVAYEAKSEGRRLGRELGILARDEVYEQAVTAASRLTGTGAAGEDRVGKIS
ncbi:MAG TPA: glucose-6-phosphate dehydrogenase assembly protein OpcA [Pyrinomonadaceae bacterium]|jgi:glucose-6-phosphate dehydrogenase assembly protein OpcA|nr:glucose-6-phosphate dehydrogenase assembly protein OpcA [Pyrinomonadaceae bacterium]